MAVTSFPDFITDRRRELELTLGDVASDIGVSPITVSNWSNGQSIPEQENLVALAAVLGLPVEQLAEMAGVELEPLPEPEVTMETVELEDESLDQEAAADVEIPDPQEAQDAGIPGVEHPTLAAAEEVGVKAPLVMAKAAPEIKETAKTPIAENEAPPTPERLPDVVPRVAATVPTTTQMSPHTYVQDPKQLLRYRIRWGITTVALIIMAFVLVWALGELFTALSDVKESVTP